VVERCAHFGGRRWRLALLWQEDPAASHNVPSASARIRLYCRKCSKGRLLVSPCESDIFERYKVVWMRVEDAEVIFAVKL
jgi:hypothetical protein